LFDSRRRGQYLAFSPCGFITYNMRPRMKKQFIG
jgi:hypothetical protein